MRQWQLRTGTAACNHELRPAEHPRYRGQSIALPDLELGAWYFLGHWSLDIGHSLSTIHEPPIDHSSTTHRPPMNNL